MSSGRQSGIVAITPPDQFPPAVWEEWLGRANSEERAADYISHITDVHPAMIRTREKGFVERLKINL